MANIEYQLEALISAARKVEYYKHFGRHGDGKDLQAQKKLARAKRHIRGMIQDGLPAASLVPATISREKLDELGGRLNLADWDEREIVEEVLHGLGIEVSDEP